MLIHRKWEIQGHALLLQARILLRTQEPETQNSPKLPPFLPRWSLPTDSTCHSAARVLNTVTLYQLWGTKRRKAEGLIRISLCTYRQNSLIDLCNLVWHFPKVLSTTVFALDINFKSERSTFWMWNILYMTFYPSLLRLMQSICPEE